MIEYRAFKPADAEKCRNLVLSYIGDATGLDPARAAKLGGWMVSEPREDLAEMFCIVAVCGGDVIGMGALDGGSIKRMYVSREYRRRGVGSEICRLLESQARRRGLTSVHLVAYVNAVAFYEALGYKRIRNRDWLLDGATVGQTIMTKDIGLLPM